MKGDRGDLLSKMRVQVGHTTSAMRDGKEPVLYKTLLVFGLWLLVIGKTLLEFPDT